jgi:LPXTG-site transpeptidase (sortase) family protein
MALSPLKVLRDFSGKLNSKPLLLVSLGIFLFCLGATRYYQLRILSFTKPLPVAEKIGVDQRPTEIIIPSLKIDIPVEAGSIKDGVWQISYDKATFLDSSSTPGEGGNSVIYGHNKKLIFGSLPYLSIGQKVSVKTADGKIHNYEVYKKEFVSPDRIDLVSPTDHEELTLFTCWGIFDSQRVVVKARPL